MTPAVSERLRRSELLLLTLGAITASLLLAASVRDDLARVLDGTLPAMYAAIYGLKLVLMEAALLAPFVVLALLSRALLRETARSIYRWAGFGISVAASVGVVVMLGAGLVPMDLEEAVDTLIANVVPALMLLSACALLYGGLIWLAQHQRPASISRRERANRPRPG